MIAVGFAQHQAKHYMFPEKIQVNTTISGAQCCLADKPADFIFLHCFDNMTRTLRAYRSFAASAQCRQHRIFASYGFLYRNGIHHIATHQLKIVMTYLPERFGIAGECRYTMPERKRLLNHFAACSACCTYDQ